MLLCWSLLGALWLLQVEAFYDMAPLDVPCALYTLLL